jgi:hypothetical protein
MKIIALKKGDRVVEKLTSLVDEAKIPSGLIIGLGALSCAELMVYKLEDKEYSSKSLSGSLEVGSFSAVIAHDPEGETHLHPHIVISNQDFETYAGHLKEGIVAATFEAVILENNEAVKRYRDSDIGLNLIK